LVRKRATRDSLKSRISMLKNCKRWKPSMSRQGKDSVLKMIS